MKCSNKMCKSGLEGLFMPSISMWGQGYKPGSHEPLIVDLLNVLICKDCRNTMKPVNFFTRDGWMRIIGAALSQKKVPPSLEHARVEYLLPDTKMTSGYIV